MNAPVNASSLIEGALSLQAIVAQVQLIQQVLREVMQKDTHYGTVPGCGDKVVLLKPGAEKLCHMFQLVPCFEVFEREITGTGVPAGHREYRITCRITNRAGILICEGVGSASTTEKKYRYRGEGAENTGVELSREYWDLKKSPNKADNAKAQDMIGGKGFMPRKIDNQWFIFKSNGEKQENQDIADTYNTVLKIAKKRAHVDATITATAASDLFTQDIDEEYEFHPAKKDVEHTVQKQEARAPTEQSGQAPSPGKETAGPATATSTAPATSRTAPTSTPSTQPKPSSAGATPSAATDPDAKARATAAFVEIKKWDELLASGLWFGLVEKRPDGTIDMAATTELRGKELPRALLGVEDAVTKVGESCARDAIAWALETYGWPMRSPQLKRGTNGSYSVENAWPNRDQALLAIRSLMGEQVPAVTKGISHV